MIFNSQLQLQILFVLQNQCCDVKEHMSKYQNRLKNKIHQKSHLCSKSTTVPIKSDKNANFAAYSPIVQRPYGLGVAKTLLRGWQHRQVCVLDLGL